MKRALYCPDCKTEFVVESSSPSLNCGLCHIKWGRRVELLEDASVGDVTREDQTPPHIEVPRG